MSGDTITSTVLWQPKYEPVPVTTVIHFAPTNIAHIELQYDPIVHGPAAKSSIFGEPSSQTVVRQRRPPNYMMPSFLACVCCFWPTGCFALYYSHVANELADTGEMRSARKMAIKARKFIFVSCIIGVLLFITIGLGAST